MIDRAALGDFLRHRREQVSAADAGLTEGFRRRTPGLRREEVALLAGISVDYYARLEQGRGSAPSASVVTALVGALQCDLDQRDHVFNLAGMAPPPRLAGRDVRPGLVAIANRLVDIPVIIVSDIGDVLWRNSLCHSLLGHSLGGRTGNVTRQWFLEPEARIMPESQWERISAGSVSDLRATRARRPNDAAVVALVDELLAGSAEFRELWERHDVGVRRADVKSVLHPEVGEVQLRCEVLLTPTEDVQLLALFPLEGTDSAEKLQLLRTIGSQQFQHD